MKKICPYLSRLIICTSFLAVLLCPCASPAETCEKWVAKAVSVQGSVEVRRVGETRWRPVKLNDTYCPGDVMASNPKWRQPLAVWRSYFDKWIFNPQPKALMYASIFFDLQCVRGDAGLLESLQSEVLKKTRGNTIFLAYMTANALQFHPPLGIFKQFVLEKGGAEEKALNMKKRGIVPITDLARVYALSAGVNALNTRDRLEAASKAGVLSRSGMADLRDALEFIASVRLQHQSQQIRAGQTPDNFVPPEHLSSLERRHLKDAFDVVDTIQTAMESSNQVGNF